MRRERSTAVLPWALCGGLSAALIGVVIWAMQRGGAQDAAVVPTVPATVAASEPPPAETPPPPPAMTADVAERILRGATGEWRAFTVDLCKRMRWPDARAAAFLENVTWNDRDKEKQHANGLASLKKMLGVESDDPVELAEALQAQGELLAFFEKNWEKLDVDWSAAKPEATALQDSWKPYRERWGFPLDTPVEEMAAFQAVYDAAMKLWQSFAGTHVASLELDDAAKEAKWYAVVGKETVEKEAKMRAGLRVLLDASDASIKNLVPLLLEKMQDQEGFAEVVAKRLEAAVAAAEAAKAE